MVRLDILVPAIYTLAAIYYALLGLYAWKKRPAVAIVSFAWAMLSISIWSFTYGLEVLFPSLQAKLIVILFEYIGIVSVPVFLFFFALEYTGRSHLLDTRIRLLAWVIPSVIVLMVWTNPLHHLMWSEEKVIVVNGLHLLSVQFSFFFWVHVVFSYGLLLLASILLVMDFMQRPGVFRIYLSLVILGVLSPLVGSFLFVAGLSPITNMDVTPLFFLPTAFGLSWASIRYRLMELLPPEHLTMLKNMKDGVIVLNARQRILYINPIAEQLFNRSENHVIGQPFEYVSDEYHKQISPYLKNGQECQAEIKVRVENLVRTFEMTVSPISSINHSQAVENSDLMITLHDITERKEAEALLSRREAIMSAISLAAEQFLRESVWEKKIREVLQRIGEAANVSRILVVRNDKTQQGLILSSIIHEWCANDIPSLLNNPEFKNIPIREAGFSRWINKMSEGHAIHGLYKDLPEEEKPFMQLLESRSYAAIPVLANHIWWGFIIFEECCEEREWTSMELDAFHAAANILGAAEVRANTEQKLIQRQRTLSLLQDIVSVSLQAQDVKEMAETVADHLGKLINADGCFVTLWDEANRRTVPLAAYGPLKDGYTAIKIEANEKTFTQSVLDLGHTLIIEDTENTPFASHHITHFFPSKSVLVLPLMTLNKKMGAVLIAFNTLHHFENEEIQISEQASSLISLALEKFQAMEEAKKRANTSETLRRAGLAIAEKLEMNEAVEHILEQLQQVVPYDSATVQLLENEELKVIGSHGWKNPNDVLGLRFPLSGDNPNRIVIETSKPYYLPETWKVFENFTKPPHNHILSWLGIPLIAHDKLIGLLAIDSSEPNDFTEEDIKTAAEFAGQVAITLENARLYQETQNQAITDPLTGLYNRRGFFELGRVEFTRANLMNRHFSAIMIDLDHFKKINDRYGHTAGDFILSEFAKRCKSCVREIDLIGRYGGEEVIIFLPDTSLKAGANVAERVRAAIEAKPVQFEGNDIQITASLGVASRDEHTNSLETLIARADQALYIAKHKGRNRVVLGH